MPKAKCRGCGFRHQVHAGPCKRRARSRCQTASTSDGAVMTVCGYRPQCTCAWRECPCGTPVAVAVELPRDAQVIPAGEVMLVAVVRGTAGDPAGGLAVRELADGHLACRDLAYGEEPAEDEWRGTEHHKDGDPDGGDCPHERKILHV